MKKSPLFQASPPGSGVPGEQSGWLLLVAPVIYVLLLCVPPLLGGSGLVLGAIGTDLGNEFVGLREFAFGELGRGRLPFWNPHIFSGLPALGNIQLGLCYPFNLIFLALPLAAAFNVSIMFHLALAGVCMGFWARSHRLGLLPSLAAGILYTGSGFLYSRVLAGNESAICLLPWAPLLFWSVDGVLREGRPGPALAGAATLAMMILAGAPQLVFHAGFAAALYALPLLAGAESRVRKILLLSAIPLLAAGVTAFQLATMLQAMAGTMRGGKLPYDYAAMFSFPPENLLTLISPFPWGGVSGEGYWGRWLLWEMQLFFGITGFVMALVALGRRADRASWYIFGLVMFLLILALGNHTPLFRILYEHVPPFGYFRGHSKWSFPAGVFLVLLAARGYQSFLDDPTKHRSLPWILVVASSVLGAAALVLRWGVGRATVPGWWASFIFAIGRSGESYSLTPDLLEDEGFLRGSLGGAALAFGIAAATILLLAFLVGIARRRQRFAAAVVALGVLEIFLFNRAYLATFPLEAARQPEIAAALMQDPGDYRVLALDAPNSAMSTGALDAWGYDPLVSRCYAEFMAFCQGVPLDTPAVDIPLRRWDPLLALLRVRYVIASAKGDGPALEGPFPHLPRALLLPHFEVAGGSREQILAAMRGVGFDPYRTAILEEPPRFPAGSVLLGGTVKGTATVRVVSTDELVAEVETNAPALLLLTDAFFPGWKATALSGSAQEAYRILRADYILQAIPLGAGSHRIRLAYAPAGLALWGTVSLCTILGLLCAGTILWHRNRRAGDSAPR
ncbi:MAG: hypothetical protein ACYC9Y_02490 [Candidatus Methylomirabilia bacterium]